MLALWYFPALLVLSGLVMIVYDARIFQNLYSWTQHVITKRTQADPKVSDVTEEDNWFPKKRGQRQGESKSISIVQSSIVKEKTEFEDSKPEHDDLELQILEPEVDSDHFVPYSFRTGIILLGVFIAIFIVIIVVRVKVPNIPDLFKFFANIFLAGSIICGGG